MVAEQKPGYPHTPEWFEQLKGVVRISQILLHD
jgi:hypothetical protein